MRPLDLAMRYLDVTERRGGDHPLIQWWLELCSMGQDQPDEIAWCSAFCNGMAWELRLPRSKRADARSWLNIGQPVPLDKAEPGWDVVIFWRENPEGWKGHVAWFVAVEGDLVWVVGGNQNNRVSLTTYPKERVLGVRRLSYNHTPP